MELAVVARLLGDVLRREANDLAVLEEQSLGLLDVSRLNSVMSPTAGPHITVSGTACSLSLTEP